MRLNFAALLWQRRLAPWRAAGLSENSGLNYRVPRVRPFPLKKTKQTPEVLGLRFKGTQQVMRAHQRRYLAIAQAWGGWFRARLLSGSLLGVSALSQGSLNSVK